MLEADTLAREGEASPVPDDLTGGVAVVIMVSIVEPGHKAKETLVEFAEQQLEVIPLQVAPSFVQQFSKAIYAVGANKVEPNWISVD